MIMSDDLMEKAAHDITMLLLSKKELNDYDIVNEYITAYDIVYSYLFEAIHNISIEVD